jgi:hypothetical protein
MTAPQSKGDSKPKSMRRCSSSPEIVRKLFLRAGRRLTPNYYYGSTMMPAIPTMPLGTGGVRRGCGRRAHRAQSKCQ